MSDYRLMALGGPALQRPDAIAHVHARPGRYTLCGLNTVGMSTPARPTRVCKTCLKALKVDADNARRFHTTLTAIAEPRTGAERYLSERLADPEYREAYEQGTR